MVLHGIVWYCMVMVLHSIVHMIVHGIALYRMVMHVETGESIEGRIRWWPFSAKLSPVWPQDVLSESLYRKNAFMIRCQICGTIELHDFKSALRVLKRAL